ncbi:class I SAM-dependent methyltransferase [Paenibacillus fonticola]|uniref:class I SAM-dependent methyltransferase n=1 Tax=Paenibacillus fonticola TaxID=379896 RepID=UPI00035ECFD1|nr:class I SAM-dependent methyltransferase [Paenibacillus fonticola]
MHASARLQQLLQKYLDRFTNLAERYDGTTQYSEELESVIDDYSAFITDQNNQKAYEQLEELTAVSSVALLAERLREVSARCVALMEKYRALKLLSGIGEQTDYFKNIESCIETEFGGFQITAQSKVLMIGSGSFPMTPLLIAKRTEAEVVGIDIDAEAVRLGRKILERLGGGLRIRLEKLFIEQLDMIKDATHIIFSSTVASKYALLAQLHPLTNDEVVVAMRFGDQLKSLFNYPREFVDEQKWRLKDIILHPDHVFDVALYKKAQPAMQGGERNERL